ncbi:MAG: two-component system sensor histidine kinase CreC, partial [Verrucomicrobiota bacterium]
LQFRVETRRLPLTTTSRILLGFLLLLSVGLYSLQQRLLQRVERQYLEAAEESMVDAAQLFAAELEQHIDASGELDVSGIRATFANVRTRPVNARIYNLLKTEINTNVYVTDKRGIVLFDSDGGRAEGEKYLHRRDVALTLLGRYGARSSRSDEADDRSSVMFVGAPIHHAGEIAGMVSVSKPQRSVFGFINETNAWIRNASLSLFALIALGALLVATLFAMPIRQLTHYARAVARGERVPAPAFGAPELRTLGRAFEEMRDALQDRKYVENYVQTLTHEMKSPVSAIHGAAELLREEMPAGRRDRFIGNIQAESRRLQNIIDQLLSLSAIESRKSLDQPEEIVLKELAESVRIQMSPAFESRRVRLEIAVSGNPMIVGETFLLEIALTNLLQNAIAFSPAGALVRLEIQPVPDEGAVRLVVEDEGCGFPGYALERVFERFYSLQHPATGRKSSGLGLCFVREAVELHGGRASLFNRPDRSGVRAILTLPLGGTRKRLSRG